MKCWKIEFRKIPLLHIFPSFHLAFQRFVAVLLSCYTSIDSEHFNCILRIYAFCLKTTTLAILLIFNKSKDHCDSLPAQPVNTPLAANVTLQRSCLNFSQACRPQLIDESDTFSCGPCSLMWWYHYGPSQWEFLINAGAIRAG